MSPGAMKIVSWNVNGMRAVAKKGFSDFLADTDAEVVALQETRATPEQVPEALRAPAGWRTHWVSAARKGYSGVGLYAQAPFDVLDPALGEPEMDGEGRLLRVAFGPLQLVNGYFPNGSGKARDNGRVPYKLAFYRRLFERLRPDVEAGRPVLVVGDFNTAPAEIDLARPKQNARTSGFLPEEREELARWLRHGWVDTFRHFEPGPGHYSWWSQRYGVREKNIGWRIDLCLASPAVMPFLKRASIHPEVMGSDHCPISVEVDDAVVALEARG